MENKIFLNTKCYLKNKRRCAIFGEEIDEQVRITIFTCSEFDNFSKQVAKGAFLILQENGLEACKEAGYNPQIIYINKVGTVQYTFFKYCRDNFYKKAIAPVFMSTQVEVLYKIEEDKSCLN